jgi:predicted acyltransferase
MNADKRDSKRLVSLDVFRGITIAAMIIVNNPGSWSYVYPPLRHAEWHGWTPTDLVFPFFLFIVGVAISLALSRRRISAGRKAVTLKIIRRTLILFFLGIALHLYHRPELSTLRIPGVLQRIALCYLLASLLFIKTGWKTRAGLTVLLLAGYYAIMKWIPVPGTGAGVWTREGNLCGYVDRLLLGGHLYRGTFDPEGLLSSIPALATTLLGTLTGDWLRRTGRDWKTVASVLCGGIILAAWGLALDPFFPINKQLWTSTYVLFTAGAALILLAVLMGVFDLAGWTKWALPFRIFGTNAIAVFVGSSLLVKVLTKIRVGHGEGISLWAYTYKNLLASWAGNQLGSLLFPLILVLVWLAILAPLYKKGLFIKI